MSASSSAAVSCATLCTVSVRPIASCAALVNAMRTAREAVIGSTTALIKAVQQLPNQEFIVATDDGIFWKMHQLAPDKKLISAPTAGAGATCESCAHCPWMAMNALQNLEQVLITGSNPITVEADIRDKAVQSIQRMLDFAAEHQITGALPRT